MNKNNFLKIIETAKAENFLIAIYTSDDLTIFNVGYVLSANCDEFVIHSLTERGESDGVLSERIASIVKVEYDTRYLQKIGFLYSKKRNQDVNDRDWIHSIDGSVALLEKAFELRVIVGIWLKGDEISINGFIRRITDSSVELEMINSDGESDGVAIFEKSSVDAVRIGGEDQNQFTLMHENHDSVFK